MQVVWHTWWVRIGSVSAIGGLKTRSTFSLYSERGKLHFPVASGQSSAERRSGDETAKWKSATISQPIESHPIWSGRRNDYRTRHEQIPCPFCSIPVDFCLFSPLPILTFRSVETWAGTTRQFRGAFFAVHSVQRGVIGRSFSKRWGQLIGSVGLAIKL